MIKKQPSGKYLYLILWGGTFLIAAAMVAISYQEQGVERKLRNNIFSSKYASGEEINELMLSANELTIDEKKAFINLFLKQDTDTNDFFNRRNDDKRNDIYKRILQRKLNKGVGKQDADFSIKPVPK